MVEVAPEILRVGRAAVGAHLPLHGRRGRARGGSREGRRLAGGDRLAGGIGGHDRRKVLTVSVAAVVVAVPTLLVKTARYRLPDLRRRASRKCRWSRSRRGYCVYVAAAVGAHLPLHGRAWACPWRRP